MCKGYWAVKTEEKTWLWIGFKGMKSKIREIVERKKDSPGMTNSWLTVDTRNHRSLEEWEQDSPGASEARGKPKQILGQKENLNVSP